MYNQKFLLQSYLSKFFLSVFIMALSATLIAQPVVTDITPASGTAGSIVTINGTGFSNIPSDNVVFFGGMRALVSASSATSLTVLAPVGKSDGPVTVTTNHLTAYSNIPFNTTFPGGGGLFTIGSFAPVINIPATNSPRGIKIADLNNDNKPEILITGLANNSLSVFSNTGAGNAINFSVKQDFPSGSFPWWIATGDVDGDGLLDVAVGNTSSNTISVFRNTSSGSTIAFDTKIDYALPSYPNSVSFGELDGDGKPDLIVATHSNSIAVFKNTSISSSISFGLPVYFSAGSATSATTIADVNADGKADIIACDQFENTVSILKNASSPGTISFNTRLFYTTGSTPHAVSVADIDGDSKPDISVANRGSSSVSIFRNTGTGTSIAFTAKQDFPVAVTSNPSEISLTDINGDARPDIVTSNYNSTNNISVLKNISTSGVISFATSVNYTLAKENWNLAIGDINVDGMPDILTTSASSKLISIITNKLSHAPVISSFNPVSGGETTIVTVKGSNLGGTTAVSFGGVNATSFTITSDTSISTIVSTGASGNVSVTTPAGTATLGGFTFTQRPAITSFTPVTGPVGQLVTITGSNFSTNPTDNVVYFGGMKAIVNTASSNALTVTVPSGALYLPISVTVGNHTTWTKQPFNVTFPGGIITDSSLQIKYYNRVSDLNGGSSLDWVEMSDLDGDGRNDIIFSNYAPTGLMIFRNTTIGDSVSFAAPVKFSNIGNSAGQLSIADLDGDGKLDLAAAIVTSNLLNFFRNTSVPGTISFASPTYTYCDGYPYYISIGDIDSDGKADLAVATNSGRHINVYRNTSTISGISFSSPQVYATPHYSGNTYIGDVDQDGKLDVISVADYYDSTFSVFRNTSIIGSISFSPRQDFNSGKAPRFATMADFDGDGIQDLAISKTTFVNLGGPPAISDSISIYKNQSTPGNIKFAPQIEIRTSYTSKYLELSDLNGDGKVDLIAVDQHDYISVLRNTSTTNQISFAPRIDYSAYYNPHGVAAGDLNNDGKPDLAAVADGKGYLFVYLNYNRPTTLVKEFMLLDTLEKIPCTTIQFHWVTENELGTDSFHLQRSLGGGLFYTVAKIKAGGTTNGLINYSYTYTIPDTLMAEYRIRMVGLSGEVIHSNQVYRKSGQPSPPLISPPGSVFICQGSDITLQSSASNNNQWYKDGIEITGATDPQYIVSVAGNYRVKIHNPSCSSVLSNPVIISIKTVPPQPGITQNGNLLQSSATSGNQWYLNGNVIPGATSSSLLATNPGTYTVKVTLNGCSGIPSDPVILMLTSINSPELEGKITIAPNPVFDQLTITHKNPAQKLQLSILDMHGKVIYQQISFNGTHSANLKNIASGIYVVCVRDLRNNYQLYKQILKN